MKKERPQEKKTSSTVGVDLGVSQFIPMRCSQVLRHGISEDHLLSMAIQSRRCVNNIKMDISPYDTSIEESC